MKVAVVIPAYKCKSHILGVLAAIGPEVDRIYVVDDACPDKTGDFVKQSQNDSRVQVLDCDQNRGVGGAVLKGYQQALQDNADIVVKIDGDGQMDPRLVDHFIKPIVEGWADYTKGNRFFNISGIEQMPKLRIFGNAVLSFFSKLSSGYWDLFDPNNGYTAIHAKILPLLAMSKISNRYFFESDMLFRLNIVRARVVDIPMQSVYGEEQSNLKISKITHVFLINHCRNLFKRIFYNYFLRGFNVASLFLICGVIFSFFGVIFGAISWHQSSLSQVSASAGTVMLSALPIIVGGQMILSFLSQDMSSVPKECLHRKL